MHKEGKETWFSPTDVATFAGCAHALRLEMLRVEGAVERPPPDPQLQVVQRYGDAREKAFLAKLRATGESITEIAREGPVAERVAATKNAMAAGAPVIYQAALERAPFRGYADFLIRVEGQSKWGSYSYEVADTKLSASAKAKHLIQVVLYSWMLQEAQGYAPKRARLELGSGESASYRLDDYRHYVKRLAKRFRAFVAAPTETSPERCASCATCAWAPRCEEQWVREGHLNQVAGITAPQIRRLREAGVHSLPMLAALEQPIAGINGFDAIHAQAVLQHRKREAGVDDIRLYPIDPKAERGFFRLPAPDDGDLYFDMEGFPYEPGGLEYLFGVSYLEGGSLKFTPFWAHDRRSEKSAFEAFVDFVTARVARFPKLHIYHYADYERRALRNLMQRHATREAEVDQLLREQRLVDLYAVAREAVQTSEPRLSIKNLESFYMKGERQADVKSAGASIVFYENWRNDGKASWLEDIERYNEEDCLSTRKLHEWLLGLRDRAAREAGVGIPFREFGTVAGVPEQEPRERTPQAIEAEAKRNAARQALVDWLGAKAGAPKVPGDGQRTGQLLLDVLDFYWREAKPALWRMFDRQSAQADESFADLDVIAGMTLDEGAPPVKDKQSWVYRYRMPAQEHRLKPGEQVRDVKTLLPMGTLHELDPHEGWASLRIGAKSVEKLPEGKMPAELSIAAVAQVNTQVLEAAIQRAAQECVESDGVGQSALWRLLEATPPEIDGVAAGHPIVAGVPDPASVTSAVERMRNTWLVVQGPPGTGKTYTGARVIVALLRKGLRVAVTALSHHAIANMLSEVAAEAARQRFSFRGSRKSDSDTPLDKGRSLIVDEGSPDAALDEKYRLVGGTAWLFARDKAEGAFDYLFIDEAGQASVAGLVAVGACARNIVMLGDQMQLSQPLQGSHPGEAGKSALEYVLGGEPTAPPHLGVFLSQTWRMHPSICSFVSSAFYDGRLTAHPSLASRRLMLQGNSAPSKGLGLGVMGDLKAFGLSFVAVQHHGASQTCPEEVRQVKALVSSLLAERYRDVDGEVRRLLLENLLIVAPFNAQVQLLKEALPKGARVGTVDKFQGQEAEVVIISMTTSTGEDMPRDMAFLFDPRRLNVAISRAKTLAIVVCSEALLDVECKTPEQLALANTLCWVREAARGQPTTEHPEWERQVVMKNEYYDLMDD